MQLVRKISAKTVYGGKEAVLEKIMSDKAKAHSIFRVVGIAVGSRTGETDDYGEWQALLGRFEATNLDTGEIFRSGVCFLPQYIADLVLGQGPSNDNQVRFAFDITVQYDAASATSYVYGGIPLLSEPEDDPLRVLANTVPLTLAAPKRDDKAAKKA